MDNKPFVEAYQEINGRFIKLLSSMSALRALSSVKLNQYNEKELIDNSLAILLEYHEIDFVSVYLFQDKQLQQVSFKNWDISNDERVSEYKKQCEKNQKLLKQVEQSGAVQQVHKSINDDFSFSITAVPILAANELLGIFLACHQEDEFTSVTHERNLVIYCNFLGQLIINSRLLHEMEDMVSQRTQELQDALTEASELKVRFEELSVIDELTKLHNRRFFFPEATTSVARSIRYKKPISVLMLDVDLFKTINDRFGHNLGDKVLKVIADVLKDKIREVDILARFGGEEFVFALPETDEQGAHILAERIRGKISSLQWDAGDKKVSVTVTIGIAALSHCIEKKPELIVEELIKLADMALYHGKGRGRNQSVRYSDIACSIKSTD
ncbi:MAG: sensor domain-containing diguanylate cyclase [Gammaproteobacteria bacterium]|nr:sensor domain-containing diguanylate cyclase [Gammaproteobacteria bacterium]